MLSRILVVLPVLLIGCGRPNPDFTEEDLGVPRDQDAPESDRLGSTPDVRDALHADADAADARGAPDAPPGLDARPDGPDGDREVGDVEPGDPPAGEVVVDRQASLGLHGLVLDEAFLYFGHEGHRLPLDLGAPAAPYPGPGSFRADIILRRPDGQLYTVWPAAGQIGRLRADGVTLPLLTEGWEGFTAAVLVHLPDARRRGLAEDTFTAFASGSRIIVVGERIDDGAPTEPFVIAEDEAAPTSLVADIPEGDFPTDIFWVNRTGGQLRRGSVLGGAVVDIATGIACPRFVVADASYLYVLAGCDGAAGQLLRFVKEPGAAPTVLADGLLSPSGLVRREDALFFLASRRLWRVYAPRGDPAPLAGTDGPVRDLVVNATHAFWIQGDTVRRAEAP